MHAGGRPGQMAWMARDGWTYRGYKTRTDKDREGERFRQRVSDFDVLMEKLTQRWE